MTDVVARIKVKGKAFEVLVNCDKAMSFKKLKQGSARDFLAFNAVFSDWKKGFKAAVADLKTAFNTDDVSVIAEKIVKDGEVMLPQEYRDNAREAKLKQVIDFLSRNCVDPRTNAPYTAQRIEQTMKEVGARIDENRNTEEQALAIIQEIQKKIPIKIETKRISITLPPEYTGKAYGMLKQFKTEKEDWLNDGSLRVVINLPAGMQLEFYDKLNNMTHGAAITEELRESK